MKSSIWIICFENPFHIGAHSHQLLHYAKKLAIGIGVNVAAICIGDYSPYDLQSLSCYGADEVIYCSKICSHYRQAVSIIMDMLQELKYQPNLITLPSTQWGKNIAADLAIKLDAGLTADCINIDWININDKLEFVFTRAALNSTVLAQIHCINTHVSMCTCKENVFHIAKKYLRKNIPVRKINDTTEEIEVEPFVMLSEPIGPQERNITLENAKVVFGIGRGVQNKVDLSLIEDVAKKYNAAITGTRPVVEKKLIDKKWQVGQSGISISPEIYVAIGISGATQHIVGIKNAKTIVAINSDKNAPIFTYSDYCVIDDFRAVFKALL